MAPVQSAVTSTSDVTRSLLVSGATTSQGTGANIAAVTTASCAAATWKQETQLLDYNYIFNYAEPRICTVQLDRYVNEKALRLRKHLL